MMTRYEILIQCENTSYITYVTMSDINRQLLIDNYMKAFIEKPAITYLKITAPKINETIIEMEMGR